MPTNNSLSTCHRCGQKIFEKNPILHLRATAKHDKVCPGVKNIKPTPKVLSQPDLDKLNAAERLSYERSLTSAALHGHPLASLVGITEIATFKTPSSDLRWATKSKRK